MDAETRGPGHEGPFAAFYARERQRTIGLAWLLTHDAAVAEDIAHESFARILRRFDTLDDPSAYLRRTVVHEVYQRSRRATREARRLSLVAPTVRASTDGPTGGLADVIATLPLDQRTVVVLRFWADLDHRAIGDAMHLRPSSVRSLLTRALTRLRKDIEP